MRTIIALHTLQDGQAVTSLGNLPGPDEKLPTSEMLAMARQIHQHAIDAQRIGQTPARHPATPNFHEFAKPEDAHD